MIRAVLLTVGAITLAVALGGRSPTPRASAAVPAADVPPTWICCTYTCRTSGGPSHETAFCHASTIGSECPQTPAPSDAAQACTLVSQRPAEGCSECVSR